MLLLLAKLIDFRHGRTGVVNLNGDPGRPAQVQKSVGPQDDTGLFTVRCFRYHDHVLPRAAADLFGNAQKVPQLPDVP